MKKHFLIIIFLIFVGVSWMLFKGMSKNQKNTPLTETKIAESGENDKSTLVPLTPVLNNLAQIDQSEEEKQVVEEDTQRSVYLAAFETPIEYHGKVLDESGKAIATAEVKFNAVNNPHEPLSPTSEYITFSDSSGYFSITEITGTRLTVNVSKEGYRLIPNDQGSIGYHASAVRKDDGEIPTKAKPAFFVMQKINAPVPLIKRRIRKKLPLNGDAISIDLLTGNTRTDGPFKVSIVSDYDSITNERQNWEAKVVLSNGGFAALKDQVNHEAPEDGYSEEIIFRFDESMDYNPKSVMNDYYFIVGDGKQYGRMNLYVSSTGALGLTYYLNPEGSRNLQYDRALDVTKSY